MAAALLPHAACGSRARGGGALGLYRLPRGARSPSFRSVTSFTSDAQCSGALLASKGVGGWVRGGSSARFRRRRTGSGHDSLRCSASMSSSSAFAFAALTSPAPAARPGYATSTHVPGGAATGGWGQLRSTGGIVQPKASRVASATTAPTEHKDKQPQLDAAEDHEHKDVVDRGLGLRRALSDETQSRPFQPLGGEVLHIGWLRTESDNGEERKGKGAGTRKTAFEYIRAHF